MKSDANQLRDQKKGAERGQEEYRSAPSTSGRTHMSENIDVVPWAILPISSPRNPGSGYSESKLREFPLPPERLIRDLIRERIEILYAIAVGQ